MVFSQIEFDLRRYLVDDSKTKKFRIHPYKYLLHKSLNFSSRHFNHMDNMDSNYHQQPSLNFQKYSRILLDLQPALPQ